MPQTIHIWLHINEELAAEQGMTWDNQKRGRATNAHEGRTTCGESDCHILTGPTGSDRTALSCEPDDKDDAPMERGMSKNQ